MPPSPSLRPQRATTPPRDRGDACPGALRLHAAADGALARVRVPAGQLTLRQTAALADAAERLGDGRISLTSRGNAELRGLSDGCGQELAALLSGAGLLPSARHERVRNILASPLAGLDRRTPADVRRWAGELDGLLCASDVAPQLSGRFLFVLDDGRGDVAALGGDVTLVAEATESAGTTGGALLFLGTPDDVLDTADGSPAALRIAGPDVPRAALTAAEHFLAAADGTGAWRVRDLPADRMPTVRETGERLRAAGVAAAYVPPGDVPAYREAPSYGEAAAPGIVEGPGGSALSVQPPLGRLTCAQWRLLTDVAATDGDGTLRLTPWRGVIVPGLAPATAARRLPELAAAGLITDPASPWHRIGACTGRPGCAKSLTDVRADAAAAVAADATGAEGLLPVQWSGCARRCGHPHGTWIDVLAAGDGYRVSVVRPGAPPAPVASGVTARQAAGAVAAARAAASPAPSGH
ncbi:precorrin-3B synthase [Streptomyces sp. NPDC048644]|uniref:precorrin-3B synthase n=1 Tax=Streptomyces sp. NPDC048644 TaxID=3365582 RepID=UPI00371745C9